MISPFSDLTLLRSSRPEMFLEKGVLNMRSKFTRERPCGSVISIKLKNTSGRLLLTLIYNGKVPTVLFIINCTNS